MRECSAPDCSKPCTRKWCSEECRKRTKYGGTCEKCGAATNGSNGPGTAAKLCNRCVGSKKKLWTKETIIAAMKAWVEEYGDQPRSTQWQRSTPGVHPGTSTVLYVFGSWNAAIEAAGLTPRKPGRFPTPVDAPSTRRPPRPRPVVRRDTPPRILRIQPAATPDPPPTLPSDSPLRRGESVRQSSIDREAEEPSNSPAANRARVNRMRSE